MTNKEIIIIKDSKSNNKILYDLFKNNAKFELMSKKNYDYSNLIEELSKQLI